MGQTVLVSLAADPLECMSGTNRPICGWGSFAMRPCVRGMSAPLSIGVF